ncbi:MAG: M81 family metallopeptidase [Bacillota bacterium]
MSFRVALGGIVHETNTYCKGTTQLEEFRIWRGDEIIASNKGVRSYVGGMLDAAEALGATVLPTLYAVATPSGTIAADAYASMLTELLEGIRAAMPVDAVALSLHGAGVVEEIDDLEGHLCQRVRELVGPSVKIVVALDLHGNLTQAMADAVELSLGVHYYPHTDMYERGHEAVTLIPRLLSGELQPVTHVESIPMLLPTSTTDLYPAKAVNEVCWELERQPGMVDVTFFHGFPYTDIPQVGVHVVAIANGDRELARESARKVARWVWEHRDDFRPDTLTPEQAIARALAVDGGPVVINDTADNPGGGTPGDATHLLRAMLEAKLENACFGFIYDPEVAAQAHAAGVGATIQVKLGGKYDDLHGAPLELTAYVKSLTDGRFIRQSIMGRGARVDYGKMARLVVGGVDILVSSVRSQTVDAEVFLLHGIDVSRCKIVALKSSQHFRAAFEPIAREIITADSPGLTTLRVETFARERSPRPCWPLDPEYTY